MIIDHGEWEIYQPENLPPGAPENAMFSRKVGTHEDWYEYQKTFKPGTVVMTVERTNDGDVIQAVSRDPSMIFPGYMRVIEETEYAGKNPQNELGQRWYNADLRKISDKRREPHARRTADPATGDAERHRT